jgi:hypothetical protein
MDYFACFFCSAVRKIPVDGSTGNSVDLMSVATGGSKAKAVPVSTAATPSGGPYFNPGMKSLFVQVSFVFILVSGYYAMVSLFVSPYEYTY